MIFQSLEYVSIFPADIIDNIRSFTATATTRPYIHTFETFLFKVNLESISSIPESNRDLRMSFMLIF